MSAVRLASSAVSALFALLMLPFLALNAVGGIVSVVWLLVLGEWRPVLHGAIAMMVASFAISIVMLPNLLFVAPGAYFASRGNLFVALLFSALGGVYSSGVMVVWSLTVFIYSPIYATPANRIPLLIWSYTVATYVWSYLARKDGGSASFRSALFLEISYLVGVAMVYLRHATIDEVALSIIVVMAIPLVINLAVGTAMAADEARSYR